MATHSNLLRFHASCSLSQKGSSFRLILLILRLNNFIGLLNSHDFVLIVNYLILTVLKCTTIILLFYVLNRHRSIRIVLLHCSRIQFLVLRLKLLLNVLFSPFIGCNHIVVQSFFLLEVITSSVTLFYHLYVHTKVNS